MNGISVTHVWDLLNGFSWVTEIPERQECQSFLSDVVPIHDVTNSSSCIPAVVAFFTEIWILEENHWLNNNRKMSHLTLKFLWNEHLIMEINLFHSDKRFVSDENVIIKMITVTQHYPPSFSVHLHKLYLLIIIVWQKLCGSAPRGSKYCMCVCT